jgi:CRISPR/Cas system-associated exonuclease Cas4 (RecB family)
MDFPYLKYSVYKTCPLQYFWRFIQNPPFRVFFDRRYAFLGLVLAKIVERFYLEKWWDEPDPIARMRKALPLVSQQFIDADKLNFRPEELRDWLTIAHETFPLILGTIKAEKLLSDELYVEREEEIAFGDSDKLQMRPDLIIVRKGITTLLDGKGGKTVGRYVDDDQLIFYAGIWRELNGRIPHRVGFWWFRHGKIVWLKVSNEEVDRVLVNARKFIDCIEEKQFEPSPGQHCRLCDYRVGCDAGQRFIAERHKVCDAEIPEGNFGEVSF